MNRGELRAEVRNNVIRDSSSVTDAQLNTAINWAQRWIGKLYTFEEVRKTYEGDVTTDESQYNFPTRIKDVYDLRVYTESSYGKVYYVNPARFDKDVPYPPIEGTGQPTVYVDYGGYFQLFPTPDDAYNLQMRCSIYPPDLDDDTASSIFVEKDYLIVAKASERIMRMIRELDDAEYWSQEAMRMIQEEIVNDHSAEDWDPIAKGFSTQPSSNTNYHNPWARGR